MQNEQALQEFSLMRGFLKAWKANTRDIVKQQLKYAQARYELASTVNDRATMKEWLIHIHELQEVIKQGVIEFREEER